MSLLERAQKDLVEEYGQQVIEQVGVSRLLRQNSSKDDLALLHEGVKAIIPADKLAGYVADNVDIAKAEIRRAAKYCFTDKHWDSYNQSQKESLVAKLIDYMFGFGPIESLLDNPDVTEVMINGTNSIYYETYGKLSRAKINFKSDEQVRALIDRILGPLGRRIDESSPMVNARLKAGHRVHAIIPPLAIDGPTVTIRKFSEHVISLEEMVESGSIDVSIQDFLIWSVLLRKNIAVSGGTGSGKTTLLNALSCMIPHTERILTIEDSAELRFLEHPHVVRLEARPVNAEGRGEVTIRDLVINALRMRPDRIVVGECRGAEALDMLQAMNTGHDGSLTTLHANSPNEAITRLTTMVRYAVELPVEVIEAYIASAIDIVIQTTRAVDGSRFVSEIVEFKYDSDNNKCQTISLYSKGLLDKKGTWHNIPKWIENIEKFNFASLQEVASWKSSLSL